MRSADPPEPGPLHLLLHSKEEIMDSIYVLPSKHSSSGTHPEKLLTLKEAADAIGCFYWQLQRAVKRGNIPAYTPFNSRKLVKLSEVVAFIEATREGGDLG